MSTEGGDGYLDGPDGGDGGYVEDGPRESEGPFIRSSFPEGYEDEGGADGLELDDQQANEIRNIFLTTLPQYLEPVEEMLDQLFELGRRRAGFTDDEPQPVPNTFRRPGPEQGELF